ncbi:hypothetical protein JQ616_11170 [Bradyrhizobium tropiciagri]|uniref:hypothetical protein n=1 Tax=Bradyrhizobium tropiciagri TaxID=312253 RepID=UPI001BA79666|nr:hypothetical protein [Bradyrhizobium tropiciagri]MBR0895510.1 hypothetical protein [Bradyrhizobium tropiciagri]
MNTRTAADAVTEYIDVFRLMFRGSLVDETILMPDETIFGLFRRTPETPDRYQTVNTTAPGAGSE